MEVKERVQKTSKKSGEINTTVSKYPNGKKEKKLV